MPPQRVKQAAPVRGRFVFWGAGRIDGIEKKSLNRGGRRANLTTRNSSQSPYCSADMLAGKDAGVTERPVSWKAQENKSWI